MLLGGSFCKRAECEAPRRMPCAEMEYNQTKRVCARTSERVQIAPRAFVERRRSTKCHRNSGELARSIYFFFRRYVASQLDIFLASLEIRYMLTSFAFDMLPHGKRESIAPHLLLLHSRCPLATHIERVSAISSFVYLVCDEVCKTYRATRGRRHIDAQLR